MAESTFELGLVMAGAISGGSYAAGVVDFLIQALDAWYDDKAMGQPSTPDHAVKLRVMSGASAGAMCTGLAAVAFQAETSPVTNVDAPPEPARNRLFDCWVKRIDIKHLLGERDLGEGEPVRSALDATVLREIALDGLKMSARATPRVYVDDPFAVFLTVANLRGVPYGFGLAGEAVSSRYGMLAHADHMRFKVTRSASNDPFFDTLDVASLPQGPWPGLAEAALASGAFPVGLQSRLLKRPVRHYDERFDFKGKANLPGGPTDSYSFLCVDGGLMNNEPLELARRYLSGGEDSRNPRAGEKAHRAVIMVDPFPNRAAFPEPYEPHDDVVGVIKGMFGALVNQARFKPEELALAENDEVFSRFMIAPSLKGEDGKAIEPAMTAAILGGFGGFLSEDMRRHDFQLGRRNCQRFLSRHFVLPETNPVFADATEDQRAKLCVRNADGTPRLLKDKTSRLLPIVPLCGDAATPIDAPRRPSASAVDVNWLQDRIKVRATAVGERLIDTQLAGFAPGIVRWGAKKYVQWSAAAKVATKAREILEKELARL